MSDALARKKFIEFTERTGAITDAELDDYWASLRPVTIDGMLGEWKGGEVVTGHRMNGQLEKARWFGKSFTSTTAGQRLEQIRREGPATMVYDGQPVHDPFKTIDDSTLKGIMNGKGVVDNGRYF